MADPSQSRENSAPVAVVKNVTPEKAAHRKETIWKRGEIFFAHAKLKDISLQDLEILCALDFTRGTEGDAYALEMQKNIASYLYKLFLRGSERAAANTHKYHQYKNQAKNIPGVEEAPTSIYDVSNWAHFFRIFYLRVGLVARYFRVNILPRLYAIAGLGYFLDLAIDIVDIIISTLRKPGPKEDSDLTYWQRFKNAMNEDGRLPRMENAVVWGPINLVTFLFTAGMSALLITASGVLHDIFAELFMGGKVYLTHKNLLNRVSVALNKEKENLSNSPNVDHAKKEISKLEAYQEQLEIKLSSVKKQRAFKFFNTIVVMIGFGLILYPPTMIAGVVVTAIGLALDVGRKSWPYYQKRRAPQQVSREGEIHQASPADTTVQSKSAQPFPGMKIQDIHNGLGLATGKDAGILKTGEINASDTSTNKAKPSTWFSIFHKNSQPKTSSKTPNETIVPTQALNHGN